MLFHDSENPNAHLTAIPRPRESYPTRFLFKSNKIKGKVLDFGCGHGMDVHFLKNQGIDAVGYDPFYLPNYPTEKFDTILCHYVLNVLMQKEQTFVLMSISELLKPSGSAYFSVRRDLQKVGFRTHIKYNVQTYQCNVRLNEASIHKTEHCEIYEYKHYNQKEKTTSLCSFCMPDSSFELLTESATMYAILNPQAKTAGHTFIISKRHKKDYFDLAEKEKIALEIMILRVKHLLNKRYKPCGYDVYMDSEITAIQNNEHFCCHVIPKIYH